MDPDVTQDRLVLLAFLTRCYPSHLARDADGHPLVCVHAVIPATIRRDSLQTWSTSYAPRPTPQTLQWSIEAQEVGGLAHLTWQVCDEAEVTPEETYARLARLP